MRCVCLFLSLSAAFVVGATPVGTVNIDATHRFAWGENIGWINWLPQVLGGGEGAVVDRLVLSGLVWSENVGWINLGDGLPGAGDHYGNTDAVDFGVNVDPVTGDLFGLAWGENIGWLNFDTVGLGVERARFDKCQRRFVGYAWGENVGWINLNDAKHFVGVGPCQVGDMDCDGDIDLDDHRDFLSVFNGPNVITDCSAADSDGNLHIDLRDAAHIQITPTTEPARGAEGVDDD